MVNYGAVGDGVTDDAAAIVAACVAASAAGGGQVLFPVGTYRVGSSIQPPSNGTFYNIRLTSLVPRGARGATSASAVLRASSSAAVLAGKWESCAVSDLVLDGNGLACGAQAYLNYSVIERVEVVRWNGAGLRLNTTGSTPGSANRVQHCVIADGGAVVGPGLDLGTQWVRSWVTNNTVEADQGSAAIRLAASTQNRVTGNQLGGARHPRYGIWIDGGGTEIQLTGNTIDGTQQEAIRFDGGSAHQRALVNISDNTVRQWGYSVSGWPAVTLNGSTGGAEDFVISANTFSSDQAKTNTISILSCQRVLVTNNVWTNGYALTAIAVAYDANSSGVRLIGNTDGDNFTLVGSATSPPTGVPTAAASFAATIGDGTTTTFVIAHNLNTIDVVIGVWETATGIEVNCDRTRTDVNTVTLTFAQPPATDAYRVAIIGNGQVSTRITSLTEAATLETGPGFRFVVLCDDGAAPVLPSAVDNASSYVLKNISSSSCAITTTSSQSIEGQPNGLTISAGASVEVISDGANWRII